MDRLPLYLGFRTLGQGSQRVSMGTRSLGSARKSLGICKRTLETPLKRKILASASIFHAINDAATVCVPMIFPLLYSRQIIISSYSHIGILANLGLLTTFLFQIILVNNAHKIKYQYFLFLSIIGISSFLYLLTLSQTFIMLLLLYLFLRTFMSFYHPLGIAMVSRTHPDKKLDFAMGIQNGSGNLGVFLAFISVGYMSQEFGWKAPLYLWSMIGIFFGLICFLLVRNTPAELKDTHRSDLAAWLSTLKLLKNLVPGFIFGGACWGTTVYYAPSLLNHKLRVPLGKTGVYLALWIVLGTLMPYTFGFLARKLGRWNIALAGIAGATIFVFVFGITQNPGIATAALLFFGAFLFLVFPAFQSMVGARIPARRQNIAFSLAANIQMLSGAVVNLLAGLISDHYGINYPFLFLAVMGIIILANYIMRKNIIQVTAEE